MKQNKRGNAFNLINAGMISFLGFMLIVLLTILLVSTVKTTSIVCASPARMISGSCVNCYGITTWNTTTSCCLAGSTCTGVNFTNPAPYDGDAYNATILLGQAAQLPSQFAQIIVIVVIIVGILAMLGAIGYNVYNKMKK